ncbi:MAG TPA: CRISPR-associated endonuclease Cas2 [Tahibacter sp.]|nr:CRISPR-associated endonuclease Cas2 [Tahibacter sp.]
MSRHALYVVAYDVSDDRERDRVDRVLCGFGFRAQKSVFECRMSRTTRKQLEARLAQLDLTTGHVLIYRSATERRVAAIGHEPPVPKDDAAAFVI